jgi:hypothetical protein
VVISISARGWASGSSGRSGAHWSPDPADAIAKVTSQALFSFTDVDADPDHPGEIGETCGAGQSG